jgi:phenylacetate-coenzyme A ligase PaaK-like adenylate-forming protein
MYRRTPLESWVSRKVTAGKMGLNETALTRQGIADYQLAKLRETIRWARQQSPFYARCLGGFSESQLTSLDDLRRLPFTDANDLRENGLQFLCVPQGEIDRVVTLESSGTSGEPKRVYFTAEDQELTVDFFQAGMSTLVRAGETVLIALPGERPGSVGDLLATALRRLGAKSVLCGAINDPATVLEVMTREQVDCIVGIPVQMLSLIRHRGEFADIPSRYLTRVLLCSDHVPDSIVRVIQRAWDCEVFEHYGMTEMGLGGGVDCGAHSGYHLREADLYFEIVDVETGEPVSAGEFGEIVFTTLTRRGMPFIRYRTGDISRFLPEDCECGTMLRRLERVRTRKTGRVRVGANSEITMATLDEALFGVPRLNEFTATVVHGNPATLSVTAFTSMQKDGLLRIVREVLDAVPRIRSAEEAGELKVEVKIADGGIVPRSGKRMIVERVA